MSRAQDLITRYALQQHPEGGWFRETHRSEVNIAREALPDGYPGDRTACTSILFLLAAGEASARHRVRSEELWLHQSGDDLQMIVESPEGEQHVIKLGHSAGAVLQYAVNPGWWQSALPLPGDHGYALVGCVVAPGFDFADFELADTPAEDEA